MDYSENYISNGSVGKDNLREGIRTLIALLPVAIIWTLLPIFAILSLYNVHLIPPETLSVTLILALAIRVIDLLDRGSILREELSNSIW